MKRRLKKWWSAGWRVAVCLLLLLWVFHSIFLSEGRLWAQQTGTNWEQLPRTQQWHLAWTQGPKILWHTLRQVRLDALLLSVLLFGLALWLGVVRWRLVLAAQGLDLSLARAIRISLVAQFFNSFLLGSTGGDLIKAYYAARETHHKKTEAVTTVFLDRLVGLWAMLLFAGVMMLPNWQMLKRHGELAAPALVILAMLGVLSVVLSVAFWGGVSKRFPRARHYLLQLPKGELLERSLDSCRQFGKEKTFLAKAVALSLISNIVLVLQISVLGGGLDLGIPFTALLMIVPIISCISALPITPNGLGVREGLFVVMLGVILVPKPAALSVSLLASAEGLFWSLVGGIVYMGLREKEHLSEVTSDSMAEND
jgi:glycosyltransferase 2 family protein